MDRNESGDIVTFESRRKFMNPNGGEDKIFKAIRTWENVNWHKVEESIFRLQERIFKASNGYEQALRKGEPTSKARKRLLSLQRRLIMHPYAKLLAVKRVSQQNRGRRTAGVDRIARLSPAKRFALARDLKLSKAEKPIRTVEIPKPGTDQKRILGIPVMEDRALQYLAKLALEPTWEAKFVMFEQNSFGFRPARGCHDATSAVCHALRSNKKYVLDADIKGFFDNIDHDKLLNKIECPPIIKTAIQGWLKAGKISGFPCTLPENLEKTHLGTPQGGVISPLLANIALYGLEEAVRDFYVRDLYENFGQTGKLVKASSVSMADRRQQISIIRYADDFVIIHPSLQVIQLTKHFVNSWLVNNVGVELSEKKTSIVDSANGFTFLGFQFISLRNNSSESGWKIRASVSRKAKTRLLDKVKSVLAHKSWSQEQIIRRLNPIVVGWCNYYCVHECAKDFKQVELRIFEKLNHWVIRRKSKGLTGSKLLASYFKETTVNFRGTEHSGKWIFGCEVEGRDKKKNFIFLAYPSCIKSKRHIKVRNSASPYDRNERGYWVLRSPQFSFLSPSVKKLAQRQDGKCALCNNKFTFYSVTEFEVDHIVPISFGGKDQYDNLQLVHHSCHKEKSAQEARNRKTENSNPTS